MIPVIVFIPPDLPGAWPCSREGQAYVARRGYKYRGLYRRWQDVEFLLRQREARRVILVRREHDPGRGWPVEVADQPRALLPPRLDLAVRERHGTLCASAARGTSASYDDSPTVVFLAARRQQGRAAERLIENAVQRWTGRSPSL